MIGRRGDFMIYFKICTILVAAIGLLIYALLFDRRYFFGLIVVEIICTGILSFYIFYYIGSYSSSDNDAVLNYSFDRADGKYMLHIDVKWNRRPEIFGFNGNEDTLVVRYNPEFLNLISADRKYESADYGKTAVKLTDEFNYTKVEKQEQEIYFNVKDGEDYRTEVVFKGEKPGGEVKLFFLHDYRVPMESSVYWEKDETVKLK